MRKLQVMISCVFTSLVGTAPFSAMLLDQLGAFCMRGPLSGLRTSPTFVVTVSVQTSSSVCLWPGQFCPWRCSLVGPMGSHEPRFAAS